MLKKQLKKLQQLRRTFEVDTETELHFIAPELSKELDIESLREMIDFHTEYTQKDFDRELLSAAENDDFNLNFKISEFFQFMNENTIDYFLEYLVRVYLVDKFNQEDFAFLLLPYEKYYKQFRMIDTHVSRLFKEQENYTHGYIAKMCKKDSYFLNFVLEHFDFYEYTKDFLKAITEEMDINCDEIYFFIEKFEEKSETEFVIQLKNRINEKRTESMDEDDDDEKIKRRDISWEFQQAYNEKRDRKFVKNRNTLLKYMNWLKENNLRDSSFNEDEISFIFSVLKCDLSPKTPSIKGLERLLNEITFKKEAISFLINNKIDIKEIFQCMKENILLVKLNEEQILEILDEKGFTEIINRTGTKVNSAILRKCITFSKIGAVKKIVSKGCVKELGMEIFDDLNRGIVISELMGRNLSKLFVHFSLDFVENALCHPSLFIEYLSNYPTSYSTEQLKKIFSVNLKRTSQEKFNSEYLDSERIKILENYCEDDVLFNSFLKVIKHVPVSFIENNYKRIDKCNAEIFIETHGFLDLPNLTIKYLDESKIILILEKIIANKKFEELTDKEKNYLKRIIERNTNMGSDFIGAAQKHLKILMRISEKNCVFLTEIALKVLTTDEIDYYLLEIIINNPKFFVSLPELITMYPQIVEIILIEGIHKQKNSTKLEIFSSLFKLNEFRLISKMKENIPECKTEWITVLFNNLNIDTIKILSNLLNKFDIEILKYLPQVFKTYFSFEEYTELVVFIIKKYKNAIEPYLPFLIVENETLFKLLKKKINPKVLLLSCVEAYNTSRRGSILEKISECINESDYKFSPSLKEIIFNIIIDFYTKKDEKHEDLSFKVTELALEFLKLSIRQNEPIQKTVEDLIYNSVPTSSNNLISYLTVRLGSSEFNMAVLAVVLKDIEKNNFALCNLITPAILNTANKSTLKKILKIREPRIYDTTILICKMKFEFLEMAIKEIRNNIKNSVDLLKRVFEEVEDAGEFSEELTAVVKEEIDGNVREQLLSIIEKKHESKL